MRYARFLVRYFDCNPYRYRKDACYEPHRVLFVYLHNRLRYRAVAHPYGVIRVDPRAIRWNLAIPAKQWPIGLVRAGDWDVEMRRPVDIASKLPSMRQRFLDGRRWEDTALFQDFYEPRLLRGESVKGMSTLAEVARYYERVYDPLFADIQRHGVLTPSPARPDISFMYVHIGRSGELLYTRGGNHRLGMALALDLPTIPVRVVVRHLDWQATREAMWRGQWPMGVDVAHPDLTGLRQRRHRP